MNKREWQVYLLWKMAASLPPLHLFHQSPVVSLGSSSTAAHDNTQEWEIIKGNYSQTSLCHLCIWIIIVLYLCAAFVIVLFMSEEVCRRGRNCAFNMLVCFYPSHDANSLSGQETWIADFIVHNAVKHLLLIISWEWRLHAQTQNTLSSIHFRDQKFTNQHINHM